MAVFDLFRKAPAPTVSRLGVAHSDDCATLHAACFAFPWPQPEIETLLLSSSVRGDGVFGRPDDMQGFILSRIAADEAEILTIAVSPKRRGLGLASKLMQANMENVTLAGARSWFLEVEGQNAAALALYEKFGFEKVGERKAYYRTAAGENASAFILKRPLR